MKKFGTLCTTLLLAVGFTWIILGVAKMPDEWTPVSRVLVNVLIGGFGFIYGYTLLESGQCAKHHRGNTFLYHHLIVCLAIMTWLWPFPGDHEFLLATWPMVIGLNTAVHLAFGLVESGKRKAKDERSLFDS